MCDKLVYDLSQEVDGSPNIFVRKDWINILDNMNGNYQANQSVIETSQLSNSNKWMNYREAYLTVPMILTSYFRNNNCASVIVPSDYTCGLKNWFGSIVHSITVEYNGTTIVQQTPFINMWNSFKLLTSFSYQDVLSQGSTIGFYPDDPLSWQYDEIATNAGNGFANNIVNGNLDRQNAAIVTNTYDTVNEGLYYRIRNIAFNPNARKGTDLPANAIGLSTGVTSGVAGQIWKSQLVKQGGIAPVGGVGGSYPYIQYSILGVIHLKHLCDFFDKLPLLKGAFMKLTLNLNNASAEITCSNAATTAMSYASGSTPVGGICPFMVSASNAGGGNAWITGVAGDLVTNLSIGNTYIGNPEPYFNPIPLTGKVGNNILLNIPAYTFNPSFVDAYLSASPKMVRYSDVYQYQIDVSATETNINKLITNGIANIKSVLIVPFRTNAVIGKVQYASPFDSAGAGTTAPCAELTNFQIQVSGQNAIYNTQRYSYEAFVNQLYGENAVNGGLTDGLTSGLIDYLGWQNAYHYYYVNVERMLPVEKSVPKSIQLSATNVTGKALTLMVFVEYENGMSFDLATGARVM